MSPPALAPGALLRLLRISLAPTAAADAVAGMTLATLGWPGAGAASLLVVVASLALLHGGLVLNDWADRKKDLRTRPNRPLPSGAISPSVALALGAGLVGMGLLAAGGAHPGLLPHAVALACAILFYDLGPRGALLGPLLLGTCRALNLSLALRAGFLFCGAPADGRAVLFPLLYGLHVFFLSRLGRLEDGEDPRPAGNRPRLFLGGAAALLVLAAVAPLAGTSLGALRVSHLAAPAVALLGALHLHRAARLGPPWTASSLQASMGRALGGLTLFAAVVALRALPEAVDQREVLLAAIVVLAGLPISRILARVYPPS
jgi:4-hydroxybenzoate polyprenyltransferase